MITYMLLLKRKKNMTKAQFREHYESSHVALAKKYLGHLFMDYRRHYPVDTPGFVGEEDRLSNDDESPDAITKVDFEDKAAFQEFKRLCQQPHIRDALVADEACFLDRERVRTYVCEQVRTWTADDVVKQ